MELEGTDSERKFKEELYRQAKLVARIYREERRGFNIAKKVEVEKSLFEKPKGKVRQTFWQRPTNRPSKKTEELTDKDELMRRMKELGVEDYVEGRTDDVTIREPPAPKSRLLVLDLNGIFSYRIYDKRQEVHEKMAIRLGNFMVWSRPHTHEFFTYIFEHFEVGIWSTGLREHVDPLAKLVFGKFFDQLLFIGNRDFCQAIPSEDHGSAKPIFLKNLDDLWACYPRYNRFNTLIMDDNEEAMINNPVECHFNPGTWKGLMNDNALSAKNGRIYATVAHYVKRTEAIVQAFHIDRPKLDFSKESARHLASCEPPPTSALLARAFASNT